MTWWRTLDAIMKRAQPPHAHDYESLSSKIGLLESLGFVDIEGNIIMLPASARWPPSREERVLGHYYGDTIADGDCDALDALSAAAFTRYGADLPEPWERYKWAVRDEMMREDVHCNGAQLHPTTFGASAFHLRDSPLPHLALLLREATFAISLPSTSSLRYNACTTCGMVGKSFKRYSSQYIPRRHFRIPRIISRVWHFVSLHLPPLNFITLHYAYFIGICMLSSVIFWGSSTPPRSVTYVDSLFLVTSAMTLAGLNTINLSTLNTFQQFILFLLIIFGSAILVSIVVVHTRRKAFERRFKSIVEEERQRRRNRIGSRRRSFSKSLSRSRTELDGRIFRGRAIKSEKGSPRDSQEAVVDGARNPSSADVQASSKQENQEAVVDSARDPSSADVQASSKQEYQVAVVDGARDPSSADVQASPNKENPLNLQPPQDVEAGHESRNSTHEDLRSNIDTTITRRITFASPTSPSRQRQHGRIFSMQGVGARQNLLNHPKRAGPPIYSANSPNIDEASLPPQPGGFSLEGFIGRNSQFSNLSLAERTRLGGVEYRAVTILALIVPLYFVMWQLLGCIGLGAYVATKVPETAKSNGLNPWYDALDRNIGNPTVTSLPSGARALNGLFQALAVRSGGFYVISIPGLRIGLLVLYVIMMYISVYPVVITMRNSNVYEERSLGIYADDSQAQNEQRIPGHPQQGLRGSEPQTFVGSLKRRFTKSDKSLESGSYFVRQQLRSQLSHDLWWIVLAVLFITITETSQIERNPVSFSVFNILFEVVSAYGCVGISVGFPNVAYSFSGQWHVLSKLILCAVMIRGRHRGLPVAIDRAVLLPGEHLAVAEEQDAMIRLERARTSREGERQVV
ncbi:MAG: hypothetical protein Q9217_004598 [Psora testacea]